MLEGASETDWKERNSKEQARSQFSRAGERDTRVTQVVYGDGKNKMENCRDAYCREWCRHGGEVDGEDQSK